MNSRNASLQSHKRLTPTKVPKQRVRYSRMIDEASQKVLNKLIGGTGTEPSGVPLSLVVARSGEEPQAMLGIATDGRQAISQIVKHDH